MKSSRYAAFLAILAAGCTSAKADNILRHVDRHVEGNYGWNLEQTLTFMRAPDGSTAVWVSGSEAGSHGYWESQGSTPLVVAASPQQFVKAPGYNYICVECPRPVVPPPPVSVCCAPPPPVIPPPVIPPPVTPVDPIIPPPVPVDPVVPVDPGSEVPEPSTIWMGGMALVLLPLLKLRQRG